MRKVGGKNKNGSERVAVRYIFEFAKKKRFMFLLLHSIRRKWNFFALTSYITRRFVTDMKLGVWLDFLYSVYPVSTYTKLPVNFFSKNEKFSYGRWTWRCSSVILASLLHNFFILEYSLFNTWCWKFILLKCRHLNYLENNFELPPRSSCTTKITNVNSSPVVSGIQLRKFGLDSLMIYFQSPVGNTLWAIFYYQEENIKHASL